jgi:hypothetical protein
VVFGSISSLYLISKTYKKVGWKFSFVAQNLFLKGALVCPVSVTGLTGGDLEVT